MTPDQVFTIANGAALCGWLLLIVLPGRAWVNRLVAGTVVPAAFAVLYTVIIAKYFFRSDGGFSSLTDVTRLFSSPWLLLAGWVHYLAFDLLVGSWEARDARERGINHLFVVPCLILTFLFGPAGWLLYMGVRSQLRKQPVTS
ncbi:MAG TPA: ABA4-like family protein [Vicinamibacterales bacterium]|nr:ABA4-like family protein [Vicinamibacterales bacterium]